MVARLLSETANFIVLRRGQGHVRKLAKQSRNTGARSRTDTGVVCLGILVHHYTSIVLHHKAMLKHR